MRITDIMVYTRGGRDDFDRIAAHTGDGGWSWDSLFPYMLKNDRLVPSQDGHDTTGQVDPKVHGNGPLAVSLPNFPSDLDGHVIQTTKELEGYEFNLDMNSGNTIGIGEKSLPLNKVGLLMTVLVGWVQSTIKNGRRASSATAFLGPNLKRPNLDVLINSTVTRLIQSGIKDNKPQFKTVEFATGPDGLSHFELCRIVGLYVLRTYSISSQALYRFRPKRSNLICGRYQHSPNPTP